MPLQYEKLAVLCTITYLPSLKRRFAIDRAAQNTPPSAAQSSVEIYVHWTRCIRSW